MEFREVNLQESWRATHPGTSAPTEVGQLKSWECRHDSRTVGHCLGNFTTGEIMGLAVEPEHQRQGIGSKLLSLVVDTMRKAGAKKIWFVGSPRASPADGFYRAVGWAPTDEQASDGSPIWRLPDPEATQ